MDGIRRVNWVRRGREEWGELERKWVKEGRREKERQ